LFFGSCAGNPSLEAYVENLTGILEGVREAILGAGLLDAASFADALAALRAWKQRPDAAFWYGVAWAEGVRPW
jgi:hypothetical protein